MLLFLSLILGIFSACPTQTKAQSVVSVGSVLIGEDEIHYLVKLALCMGDTGATDEKALLDLTSVALEQAVLENAYGFEPTLSLIQQNYPSADKLSRDTSKQKCFHDVFASDTVSLYRLVAARPIIRSKLIASYAMDPIIHLYERDSIEKIAQILKVDPSRFDEFPAETLKVVKRPPVGKDLGAFSIAFQPHPMVDKVLRYMKPGDVWSKVMEEEKQFRIVKLLKEEDLQYTCAFITVKKKPIEQWFRDYVKRSIEIAFYDKIMEQKLRTAYPDLWWLRFTANN